MLPASTSPVPSVGGFPLLVGLLAADDLLHLGLDRPHGKSLGRHAVGESHLLVLVAEREQRPGVAHRDRPGAEFLLHAARQLQQPDQVGHGRTVD